jgi:hypothetical protein
MKICNNNPLTKTVFVYLYTKIINFTMRYKILFLLKKVFQISILFYIVIYYIFIFKYVYVIKCILKYLPD